ncbi:hypothetical protein, partial [Heyndrickxia coagulans]|uniref:hypothetical protein n=1 Tax=Heyndrickxia coagulans TaxID=1398 RepID=UPI000A4A0386
KISYTTQQILHKKMAFFSGHKRSNWTKAPQTHYGREKGRSSRNRLRDEIIFPNVCPCGVFSSICANRCNTGPSGPAKKLLYAILDKCETVISRIKCSPAFIGIPLCRVVQYLLFFLLRKLVLNDRKINLLQKQLLPQ